MNFEMVSHPDITLTDIRKMVSEIPDPEIPVITIADLGILRDVEKDEDGFVIVITPTYSGCPAMDMIALHIRIKMMEAGVTNFRIAHQLSPAWTTEWITEGGKRKLKEFGIAPPQGGTGEDLASAHPACPQCGSVDTALVSSFGSTACKALFRCLDCREPFDYFKCH